MCVSCKVLKSMKCKNMEIVQVGRENAPEQLRNARQKVVTCEVLFPAFQGSVQDFAVSHDLLREAFTVGLVRPDRLQNTVNWW